MLCIVKDVSEWVVRSSKSTAKQSTQERIPSLFSCFIVVFSSRAQVICADSHHGLLQRQPYRAAKALDRIDNDRPPVKQQPQKPAI